MAYTDRYYRSLSRLHFLVILSAAFLLSCGNTEKPSAEPGGINIEITIDGLKGGIAYVAGTLADQIYFIDSVEVSQTGKILLSRDKPYPQGLYYISLKDWQETMQFLLDDDQSFSAATRWPDVVSNMEITGSLNNALLYENLKFETRYQEAYGALKKKYNTVPPESPEALKLEQEMDRLVEERKEHIQGFAAKHPQAFFTKFKLAGQNPELREPRLPDGTIDREKQAALYRTEYWTDMDFADERLLRTPVYGNKLTRYFTQFMPNNADTIIKYADRVTRQSMQNDSMFKFTANYIGSLYKDPTFMGSDAVYVHMVKNFFTEELAFWADNAQVRRLQLDADIRDVSMIGKKAQNLEVKGLNGDKVSLYDVKAPLTVLYIYNSQCENCQKETPELAQLYREWKSKGVEVFALATDEDEETWRNYIAQNDLRWISGVDPNVESQYTFKYHIHVTPEIYVLDKDKMIVGKDLRVFQLPAIFEKHL